MLLYLWPKAGVFGVCYEWKLGSFSMCSVCGWNTIQLCSYCNDSRITNSTLYTQDGISSWDLIGTVVFLMPFVVIVRSKVVALSVAGLYGHKQSHPACVDPNTEILDISDQGLHLVL